MDILSTSKIKKNRRDSEKEVKIININIPFKLLWLVAKRNRMIRKEVKMKKKRMLLEQKIAGLK